MSLGTEAESKSNEGGRLSESAKEKQRQWRRVSRRGASLDPVSLSTVSSRRCLFECDDPAVATSVGFQVLMKTGSVGFFLFLLFGEINVPFILCAVLLGLMLPGFAFMRYEFLSAQQMSAQPAVTALATRRPSVVSRQSAMTNASTRSGATARTFLSLFEPDALAPGRPTPMGVSTRSLATSPRGASAAQSSRSLTVSRSMYPFPLIVSGSDLSLSSRRSIRSVQQGAPAPAIVLPERSIKSKIFGWYVLVSGTVLQAFPGAMLLQLALKDSHPSMSWGAAVSQLCFLAGKTITTEAAPAFEKYTGKEIQLSHPMLKFLANLLAEVQPRFEAGMSAWSAAGALYQLVKAWHSPAAIPSLIITVPLVLPMYVAKADLYRAFDAMKLRLRTLGLTPEQQGQLFRGDTLNLHSTLPERACAYRFVDGVEYVLLGWAGWPLQNEKVNKIFAALAYGGRFAKIAVNIAIQYSLNKQGDWQVLLLICSVTSLGLFQGFVAGKVKFREPAPGAVINFQDPHIWLAFVTHPCTPKVQSEFDVTGGQDRVNPLFKPSAQQPSGPTQHPIPVTVFTPVTRKLPLAPPLSVRQPGDPSSLSVG